MPAGRQYEAERRPKIRELASLRAFVQWEGKWPVDANYKNPTGARLGCSERLWGLRGLRDANVPADIGGGRGGETKSRFQSQVAWEKGEEQQGRPAPNTNPPPPPQPGVFSRLTPGPWSVKVRGWNGNYFNSSHNFTPSCNIIFSRVNRRKCFPHTKVAVLIIIIRRIKLQMGHYYVEAMIELS